MFHSATEKGGVKASICPEEETCGSIGSDLDAMIKNIKQGKVIIKRDLIWQDLNCVQVREPQEDPVVTN